MKKKNKTSRLNGFDEITTKLKSLLSIKYDKDLATMLDMHPTAFSERAKKGSIPHDKIVELCLKKGIDLNDVFTKDGFASFGSTSPSKKITKYNKGYSSYEKLTQSEPYVLNDSFCRDTNADLVAVTCDNVHMYPLIDMGDIVIVNKNKKEPIDSKMFFVEYKNSFFVAKIFKPVNLDFLILQFESSLFPEEHVKKEELNIIGMVAAVHSIKDT